MPIYEYECGKCGRITEAFQKVSDEPLKECPTCHAEALNKLVSASSFQLKGTGWYKTDFANKAKPKEESAQQEKSQSTESESKKTDDAKKTDKTDKTSDTSSSSSSSKET